MNKIPWWMSYEIDDKQTVIKADYRVAIPFNECGNIFSELYTCAINPDNTLAGIIVQENNYLQNIIRLPNKSEDENFNDLRFTIKSYKYIPNVFLSTELIPKFDSINDENIFHSLLKDLQRRASTLEFYLLNNINTGKKPSSYYDGRLELDLYRLIQEMYILALNGNKLCEWMLGFKTPLQVWFVMMIQEIYIMWLECRHDIRNNNRAAYNYWNYYLKNYHLALEIEITELNNYQLFNVRLAVHYTVKQLIINRVSPIPTYYTNYIESIKKQSRLLISNSQYYRVGRGAYS